KPQYPITVLDRTRESIGRGFPEAKELLMNEFGFRTNWTRTNWARDDLDRDNLGRDDLGRDKMERTKCT
ncbi:Hypothetical protein FKW44_004269, partial [Caligus rogercresseyi]